MIASGVPNNTRRDEQSHAVAAIQRDLEDLLNARQTRSDLKRFPALRDSTLAFGLPDASQIELVTLVSKQRFLRTIESVVRNFEPRVASVRAVLQENHDRDGNRLMFCIEIELREEALSVQFETRLDLGTGHYQVENTTADVYLNH